MQLDKINKQNEAEAAAKAAAEEAAKNKKELDSERPSEPAIVQEPLTAAEKLITFEINNEAILGSS